MNMDALLYLGTVTAMVLIFGAIVRRTYKKSRKREVEAPKHRMLDDED